MISNGQRAGFQVFPPTPRTTKARELVVSYFLPLHLVPACYRFVRESSDPHSINPRAQAVICAQVGVRNRAHPVQAFQEDPSCLVCRWISCPITQGPESNIRNLFSSLRETFGLPKALNVCSEFSPRGNHCLPQSPCYQLREQGQLWAVRPASHSEKQLTKDRTE